MTVSYTADIANGGRFVNLWRILIKWRGSVYKLIWKELLLYCILFVAINFIHAYVMPKSLQTILQKIKGYLSYDISLFPVPFVLSFFVNQVATKWWDQNQMIPSPDTLALFVNAAIPGKDDVSRIIRRTIVRYAVLSLVLTLRDISTRIKNRFPTIKHVEEAGFILEDEKERYNAIEGQVTANNWIPLVWATNIATHAKTLDIITSDQSLRLVITELTAHRNKLGILVGYDIVNIPLVYTQTMVVVVMSYVTLTLFSHQTFYDSSDFSLIGVTISALYNFIIYVGLMKVAVVMLNPFGEDDDDFELNATVDRHIKAAYMIVDEMHEDEPEVVKDKYWDDIVPEELPYTVASVHYRKFEPNCREECTANKNKKQKLRNHGLKKRSSIRLSLNQRKELENTKFEDIKLCEFPVNFPSTLNNPLPSTPIEFENTELDDIKLCESPENIQNTLDNPLFSTSREIEDTELDNLELCEVPEETHKTLDKPLPSTRRELKNTELENIGLCEFPTSFQNTLDNPLPSTQKKFEYTELENIELCRFPVNPLETLGNILPSTTRELENTELENIKLCGFPVNFLDTFGNSLPSTSTGIYH